MNITISDYLGSNVLVIPIVPDSVPIEKSAEHETYVTILGPIKITGKKTLRAVSWESFFPVNKDYPFVANGSLINGWDYVDFLDNNLEKPIRVVITNDDKRTILNMLATIDKFKYDETAIDNISYSIELSEFKSDIWELINNATK